MKKIIIVIISLFLIAGCTNCQCNNYKTSDLSDFEITVNGMTESVINNDLIKDLELTNFSVEATNPFYEKKYSLSGIKMSEIIDLVYDKDDYDYLNFGNSVSTKRYSAKNIDEKVYLVFYKNGVKLEKPMLVKTTVPDIYWVTDVETIAIVKV